MFLKIFGSTILLQTSGHKKLISEEVQENATGFSIGTKGYIGTGYDNFNNALKDFWEYDPTTNTWKQKADFGGTARYYTTGFSIGTKGYIGTGVENGGASFVKDFWEYDPTTNT